MIVSFLEAEFPLTKKYTQSEKIPYPHASTFTSYEYDLKNLADLTNCITHHSKLGHCLLKGRLDKPLNKESRAGHTNGSDLTQWLCLDLDSLNSVPSVDAFMNTLGMGDISYVLQWSASYGIHGNFAMRCHVFVMLTKDTPPALIKLFLKQANLTHFQSDLRLAKGGKALIWGLDITTCQNDKLLFIAEPECDPPSINKFTGQRIQLVVKAQDTFDFSSIQIATPEEITKLELDALDKLRTANNLPSMKTKDYKLKSTYLGYNAKSGEKVDYMPSPAQCIVTEIKSERGFTYLNLNGGDSWGYFHPDDNPKFIHNFKGEPLYLTSELVPDYWTDIQKQESIKRAKAKKQAAQSNHGKVFLAFQEKNSAGYYGAIYDPSTDKIDLYAVRSEKQLNNFLVHHGQEERDFFPIWELIYNPQVPTVDTVKLRINTYTASKYKLWAKNQARLSKPKPTPTIDRLISHVLGNNQETVDHFKNWLAFCFQTMSMSGTGWILHGIQGTGKGALVNYIITPLFGASNVVISGTHIIEEQYNAYLENKIIVFIDEVQIPESKKAKSVMEKIKATMVSPYIQIRKMFSNPYMMENRSNWIFASNMNDPLIVDKGERRFNVGNRQETSIILTTQDFDQIENELQDFANYLETYKVDEVKARKPLVNEAKQTLIANSRSTTDEIADALREGDFRRFWEWLPDEAEILALNQGAIIDPKRDAFTTGYIELLVDVLMERGRHIYISEARIIFAYCTGKHRPSDKVMFEKSMAHKRMVRKSVKIKEKPVKGYYINWKITDEDFDEFYADGVSLGIIKVPKVSSLSVHSAQTSSTLHELSQVPASAIQPSTPSS